MRPSKKINGNLRSELSDGVSLTAELRRINLPMLPPHLGEMTLAYGENSFGQMPYVSFTPQRFGAFRMIASMTPEDISCPAALIGKLYSNRGIYC